MFLCFYAGFVESRGASRCHLSHQDIRQRLVRGLEKVARQLRQAEHPVASPVRAATGSGRDVVHPYAGSHGAENEGPPVQSRATVREVPAAPWRTSVARHGKEHTLDKFNRDKEPVTLTLVEPVVVEVSADTAWSGRSFRHPLRMVRVRPELAPADVEVPARLKTSTNP